MKKITKAIIPAAGFGTRFLPQTKAMPKEMLPIIDKPIIQYVVEEAVSAGITDIIIVTGMHKRSLEDHFDNNMELEARLRETGKVELAEQIHQIGEMANFIYVRQKGTYGNGTPILNASHLIGDEPFLVLWADDFVVGDVPRAKQLVEAYEKLQKPVITLIEAPKEDISKYGVVDIAEQIDDARPRATLPVRYLHHARKRVCDKRFQLSRCDQHFSIHTVPSIFILFPQSFTAQGRARK